jgi:hypothetical protein
MPTRIHETPADTRERTYDRARKDGIPADAARKIADDVARRQHDKWSRSDPTQTPPKREDPR